ncbi:hypothetical protein [Bacteroides sp. 51]|uniref:hypothetical protein n=1 Tax=Bacteroides sp. 51 TaxID=2302938 RepID=UPI0013D1B506|nr:hypothetical protein [Bacteroides sp. 51]NDV80817.1 hypothetical protein [Bacteroides sp. 51]
MLKDKTPTNIQQEDVSHPEQEIVLPEVVTSNPFVEIYNAVKRALLTIRENPDDPQSPPFFKTIAIDTGQFARIARSENTEFETEFPAIFVHFINVRYLVQQQRIGEGRATVRIRFILNTLNNQDVERECDPFLIFQRINVAIQDAKNTEPALNERCNLTYFDMPTTTNMLQAYWVDYEVWFREMSAWRYKNWVERYLVMPPFTDHDDAPKHDKDGHMGHKIPTYDQASNYTTSVGTDSEDNDEEALSEIE